MKRHILLAAILMTVILSGCDTPGFGAFGGSSEFSLYNPFFGSEGVSVQFLESAPPDVMYADTGFKVGLMLQNRGAIDVDDTYVALSYLDKYYDFGTDSDLKGPYSLAGKSFLRRNGEKNPVYFSGRVKDVDYDSLNAPISATVCYSYTTRLIDNICIDPDIYNVKERQKACTVRDLVLQDQGAPMVISRVEESIIEDGSAYEVYLTVHIKNAEGGIVADASPRSLCGSSTVGEQKFNRLRISGQLGDISLDCGKDGKVRIDAGQAVTTCKARITADEEYTTALRIDLDYGYSRTLPQKNVELFETP